MVYYKWLFWTECYRLLQMIILDGMLRFISSRCVGWNITVYKNRCFGRIIRVYYKLLCWTEYYGVLQVILLDGILWCITNGCSGRNSTVYYK